MLIMMNIKLEINSHKTREKWETDPDDKTDIGIKQVVQLYIRSKGRQTDSVET